MAQKPKTRQRCFFSTYLEHTQNGSGGEEISWVVFGPAKTAFRVSQKTCLEKQRSLFGQFCCISCSWGEAALVMHQEMILTCHYTYKSRTLFDPENKSWGIDCRLFRPNHLKATKRVCSWYRQSLLSMISKSPRQTYLNKKKIGTLVQLESVERSQPKQLFCSQNRYFSLCWLYFQSMFVLFYF